MSVRAKIPKGVNFGLGFRVPVVWKGRIPGAFGQYTTVASGGPRIEMRDSMAPAERYEVYAHEVLHAAIDFQLFVLREIVAPIRAEEERARALEELRKEEE